MSSPSRTSAERSVYVLLLFVLLVLFYQSFLRAPLADVLHVEGECKGEPLHVDYPFEGKYLDPHACAVQCEDGIRHYVIYSNGRATQCEELPGCRDLGEDRGETCVLKTMSSVF